MWCGHFRALLFLTVMDFAREVLSNLQSKVPGHCSVAIVGTGMSGLCMAKKLIDAGVKVS